METVRVAPDLLADRLDARYNSAAAVALRKLLKECHLHAEPMSEVFGKVNCGPFGSTLTDEEFNDSGEILVVQPTNISGDFFSTESAWRITRDTLVSKGLQLYSPGTFVFARVGVYPHVGVIPAGVGDCTISSKIIAAVCRPSSDPHYLFAFFRGKHGRPLLFAAQKSTAQPTIGTYEILQTVVPVPCAAAQRYIGDKVRQAERMTEAGRQIQRRISTFLASFHPASVPNGRTSRVSAAQLMDTLNANPYMARFVHAQEIVDRHPSGTIDQLSSSVADGPFGSNLTVSDYRVGPDATHPVVRVKNCENGFFDREDLVWIDAGKQSELIRSEVLAGDLLVTKAGRIGSAAVYPDDLPEGNITSHLIRARIKPPIDAYYVSEFLETPVGRAVTLRHSFKSTRPELTKAEIEACQIPLLPEGEMAEIARLARSKNRFSENSVLLIAAARLFVEALIEGRCSEAELADAQRSLQEGNRDLDRNLLTRLSKGGLDVQSGAKLFPDVGALYKALDDLRDSAGDQGGE